MARLKTTDLETALERNMGDLGERMKALASGDMGEAPEPPAEPEAEAPRSGPRNTAVSFTQEEYEFIKQIFEQKAHGMKVATGVKMAALYVAERLERGLISMSRAGISERR
jgi:hypothetical protein